jgi:phosphomannomutase
MESRDKKYSALEKYFTQKYAEHLTMDGVKVASNKGWFMFRKSNTEPLIRFSAESRKEETAKKYLREFRKQF